MTQPQVQAKEIETEYVLTREQYLDVVKRWRKTVNSDKAKSLTCGYHLLYAALRQAPITDMLGPVTNPQKVANGYHSHLLDTLHTLKTIKDITRLRTWFPILNEVFGKDILTQEVWDELRVYLASYYKVLTKR